MVFEKRQQEKNIQIEVKDRKKFVAKNNKKKFYEGKNIL